MNKHTTRDLTEEVSDKAMKGAKAADKTVRKSPYRALGITLGIGALIGFFFGRRGFTKGE